MTKEDIENIKELIQGAKEYGQFEGNKYFKSIENLLAERKQDKEKIKELEAKLEFKEYGDLDNLKFEEYMNEFISKEKIKNKINEYLKFDKKHKTYTKDGRENFTLEYFKAKTLKELLEDKQYGIRYLC